MKNCGDGGAGGSRAGCRGLRPLPGFGAAPQNLCRSTTSQALRAAKGRKKRGSFHPHRFPHPPPPLASLPSQISAFCALAARSPCICSHLRVALRCAQQPTGLTLPFGALMVSLPSQISAFCALTARSPCICSRLRVALPPLAATAHRAGASLRATGHALPVLPAQSSRRALAAPTARFAVHLRVALRCAQQPIGLTLPSGAPKPVPQHNPASVASGQRPQETRLAPPASFSPIRGRRGIIPPAAHLFAPLRQGFAPCAPKPAIKPYQQRSQSP